VLARSAFARRMEARDDPMAELPTHTESKYLAQQVVLVGYGRVGQRIAAAMRAHHIPFVVAEQNRETVERLRADGMAAVFGDASEPATLIQAHIARARMLVIATPASLNVRQMIAVARALNPQIEIAVRTHNETEARLLHEEQAGHIFLGEQELAQAMVRHVLDRTGAAAPVSQH
jgi:CPA2 family monovalent cation:H+ antiporter-2